jgi:hypothetical protein
MSLLVKEVGRIAVEIIISLAAAVATTYLTKKIK